MQAESMKLHSVQPVGTFDEALNMKQNQLNKTYPPPRSPFIQIWVQTCASVNEKVSANCYYF